ncbi:Uncharacterized protein DAT39_019993 [Clarias magur]|uniref:Uncharacterized protein n=1 Tax=Clarias magur TaxID=1594786 RepID=A0A8J4T6K0_CLAMG|nr:Uncharacterized protein DAT39_019993 [Clarias magur]
MDLALQLNSLMGLQMCLCIHMTGVLRQDLYAGLQPTAFTQNSVRSSGKQLEQRIMGKQQAGLPTLQIPSRRRAFPSASNHPMCAKVPSTDFPELMSPEFIWSPSKRN